jgi:tetratricopeptide (TPR) repeat protein
MDYGTLDLGEDESDIAELDEVEVGADFGASIGSSDEEAALPEPKGGVADLPQPKADFTDLPQPRQGVADLPRPKTGLEYGQLDLGSDDDDIAELDDLPVSAEKSTGLDLGQDFDLPAPKPGEQEGSSDAPDLVTPREPADGGDAIDMVAPRPGSDAPADGASSPPQPQGGAAGAASPPDPYAGGAAGTGAAVGAGAALVGAPAAEEDEQIVRRPPLLKRKLAVVGAAVAGIVLVAGITVGLVTDYGFFAAGLITGSYGAAKQAKSHLESGEAELRKDTFAAYRRAASEFEQAAGKLEESGRAQALRVQAMAASLVRFGIDQARRTAAKGLYGKASTASEERTAALIKADGLMALAYGHTPEALKKLGDASEEEPGDAQAAVYLGWARLAADKPKAAQEALERAIAADAHHAGALFALARAREALGKNEAAIAAANKTLSASAKHPGALLLKARLQLEEGDTAAAQATLKIAQTARGLAARSENATLESLLGRIALDKGRSDDAVKHFKKARSLAPASAEASLGLGKVALSSQQYNDALKHFRHAHEVAPKNLEAAVMMARTYIAKGEHDDARKTLIKIKKLAPDAPEILFLIGRVEASVGNVEAAEKNLRAAIAKEPTYFLPYLHLSRLFLEQGETDKALEVLAEANKQLPGSPRVRNAEGEVYLATGNLEEAKNKFEEALRLDENLNEALFNLGQAMARLGDLEQAKEHYLALQKKDQQHPGLAEALGELLVQLEDYAGAEEAFDLALQVDAPPVELRLAAARAYNLADKPDKALTQADIVTRKQPAAAGAYWLRGQALLAQGELDEALGQLRQAVSREKKPEYLVTLGEIHQARGRREDAIDAFSEAIAADDSLTDVKFRRAMLLVDVGGVRDAIKQLETLLKHHPDRALGWLYLGIAHAENGNEAKARRAYKNAVAKDPDLSEAHFRLGLIEFDNRRFSKAVASFERAVDKAGEEAPWRVEAYEKLGSAAFALNRKRLAREAYAQYLRIAPPGDAMRGEVVKRFLKVGGKLKKKN